MLIILNKKENEQFLFSRYVNNTIRTHQRFNLIILKKNNNSRCRKSKIRITSVYNIAFDSFVRRHVATTRTRDRSSLPLRRNSFLEISKRGSFRKRVRNATPSRGEFLGWSICKIAGDRDNSRYSTFLSRKINSKLPFNRWR